MAFARYYIDEQRTAVEHLRQVGQFAGFAHTLLRTMEDSLTILEQRRRDLLLNIEARRAATQALDAGGDAHRLNAPARPAPARGPGVMPS
jgi:hypothetical protein